MILLFFVLLAAVHLLIYTQNIKLKYETEGLKRKHIKLHAENRNLRAEVEKKKSLGRIESIAINKLHMITGKKTRPLDPFCRPMMLPGNSYRHLKPVMIEK